ncbi:formylmethanofuran dehydrogenase subunit B [Methanotorris formicicus Mc-S-70]|nr:formylmethanofuran dehydrogenase subunit B [Methanotorris formicicus Mc-S-70]
MGIQEAGLPGCTAGEVKNRADLIIFWGCNPMHSHPRHMSRYSVFARGYWTERGRKDRKIVVVDPRKTDTAKLADLHVQLKPNTDYELFSALLTILRGKKPHHSVEKITGVPIEVMEEMVEWMKNAKFVKIYGGLGLPASRGGYRNIEIILTLVRELNKYTKCAIGALRGHCNVNGFNQVASYMYGYPYGIDFARGYPRYNPGEFTFADVLREREIDAILVVAADIVAHTPRDCAKYLNEIPMVCIDIAPGPTPYASDVILPGVIDGMECGSTFYRFDGFPIYAKPFTTSPFPFTKSNEDTLRQIFEKVKEIKEGKKN